MGPNPSGSAPGPGRDGASASPFAQVGQRLGHPTTRAFWRVRDAQGREYIADSRDQLPAALRGRAERIELVASSDSAVKSALSRVEWGSFALGLGSAVLVVGVVLGLRRGFGWPLKLMLAAAVAALIAGVYFGTIRRMAGQSGSIMASPSALIDDARRAVDSANRRNREQERVLDDLEKAE